MGDDEIAAVWVPAHRADPARHVRSAVGRALADVCGVETPTARGRWVCVLAPGHGHATPN